MKSPLSLPLLIAAGLISWAGIPLEARAEPPTADAEHADALFREGRAAAKEGRWSEACPKFRESLALDPAPGTRMNVAECAEREGRWVEAAALLELALRDLQSSDPREPVARARLASLDERTPRLTVPAGAKVTVDDVERPAAFGAVRVDPGAHRLRVVLAGHEPREVTITLAERETRAAELGPAIVTPPPRPLAIAPPSAAPARSAPLAVESPPDPSRRRAGFVLLGSSALALGVGTVTGLLALDRKGAVVEHCDAGGACDAAGLSAKSEGRTFALTSSVAFAAFAVAAGTGLYLVLSAPKARGPAIGLAAGPAPGGASFSLHGAL